MSEFFKSRFLLGIFIGLSGLIVLLGAFMLGFATASHEARHFNNWCGNYDRLMFGDHRPGPLGFRPPPMMPGAHGVMGKILSATGTTLVIQGRDGIEQNVVVTSSTHIRLGDQEGSMNDLKPELDAAVFGAPNADGQIEAHLIRVLNPLP